MKVGGACNCCLEKKLILVINRSIGMNLDDVVVMIYLSFKCDDSDVGGVRLGCHCVEKKNEEFFLCKSTRPSIVYPD